jgi:hypothetical protein
MPTTSHPRRAADKVVPITTEFIPGTKPPPTLMARRRVFVFMEFSHMKAFIFLKT